MLTKPERDLGELLGDITHNFERLVKGEIKLLRVGAEEWAQHISRGAMMVAVGGLLGLLTAGLALTAAVAGLSERMPLWQAALLMAGAVGLLAILTIVVGLKAVKSPLPNPGIEIITEGKVTHRGTDDR